MKQLQEWKDRGVFRVAAIYVAAAFALIQAADLIFPRLGLPDWTVTATIVAALLGFPVALALAWAFDVKRADPTLATPPRSYRTFAYAAAAVVLLGTGATGWLLWQKRVAAAAENSTVVAVLPFAMRGNPGYSYLSTGMVDLLSRNFDGVTELRSADPGTVIEMSGEIDANVPLDLERAREIAQKVHAAFFVLGTVTENAGRVRIEAVLHDREKKTVIGSAQREDSASQLFELIDGVAADLLVDRFGAASRELARTAVTMTSSTDALKYYLRGEQALRRAAYDSATALFQNAVTQDSSFALAHYRLAVTGSLYDAEKISTPTSIAQALRHSGRLGARDRALVEAFHAYTRGEADDAERRYHAILTQYPDDMEAQFQLANVLYRYNAVRGRSPHEARPYFEKLFAVDPEFFCPI